MPLSGLDEIDWPSLTHAYGPAVTTARELRALSSDNDAERSEALASLTASIGHQGDVYPATAAAVPFLVEIALMETLPPDSRKLVIVFIDWIAQGNINLRRHHPDWAEESWGRTLERNLRQATPHLLSLLRSQNTTEVRAWAVWVIRDLPPTPEDLDALRAAAIGEEDAVVKATIALTLPTSDPLLNALIASGQDPLVRLCAAAQLIPSALDVPALVTIARESVPQSQRFAEMPSSSDVDMSPIRMVGARLGMASPDSQVGWIEHWLNDAGRREEALYAAWDAGDTRRSVARLLVDPVADVLSRSPADDLDILDTAASTLMSLGLPGVERLRQLTTSLRGQALEFATHRLASAQVQIDASTRDPWRSVTSNLAPPAELAARVLAVTPQQADSQDAMKALSELASWGPRASEQAAVVEKLLDHPRSVWLRAQSARALAQITCDYARSVAVLMRDFEPAPVGVFIARVLGEFGQNATAALPMLREYVDRDLRPEGIWALEDDLLAAACADAIKQIEPGRPV